MMRSTKGKKKEKNNGRLQAGTEDIDLIREKKKKKGPARDESPTHPKLSEGPRKKKLLTVS